jgi:tRNA-Thr(GGU) m(6)t(6)A37 methyltransferase TsaA
MADDALRQNEVTVELPPADASLVFIGTIRTPWSSRRDCPHGVDTDGPLCRIEVHERWAAALDGIETSEWIQVLYWLHEARRDLVRQSPTRDGSTQGTFALRSPLRPNPIGSSVVRLVRRQGALLEVRGLDCVDGTPLLDLKPEACPFARLV